jgi:hypothetical protein
VENQIIDRTRDAQNSASSVRSMAYFRIDRTQFSIDRSRRDVSLKLLLSQRAMERAVGRKKSPYNLSINYLQQQQQQHDH